MASIIAFTIHFLTRSFLSIHGKHPSNRSLFYLSNRCPFNSNRIMLLGLCIVILFWNRSIRSNRSNRCPCALAILYYSDLFYSLPITIPHFSKLCAITIRAHNTASVLNAQHFLIRMPYFFFHRKRNVAINYLDFLLFRKIGR